MNTKSVTAESIRTKKKQKKKKSRTRKIIAIVLLFLSYGIYLLFAPHQGGPTFGACKTFLELYVRNPRTLRLSSVDDFGDSLRIWFTQVDSFGEYRLEPIQCFFRYATDKDKQKYGDVSFVISKVTFERREVNQDVVNQFNASLISLSANPPDLTLPSPIPNTIENLQIDTDRFRKPIF